jgi:hypothetical protein
VQQVPTWVQIVNALAIPLVALAAALIGLLQWRTAERKRRQDLFDKRYDNFKRAQQFYEECMLSDRGDSHGSFEMRDFATEAEFLFGPDVGAHMRDVVKNVCSGTHQYDFVWFTSPFKKYLQLR